MCVQVSGGQCHVSAAKHQDQIWVVDMQFMQIPVQDRQSLECEHLWKSTAQHNIHVELRE